MRGCWRGGRAAGLDEVAAVEAAWDPDWISAFRFVREEALSIGVHGVPSVATEGEVLYYGAASPGKIHALLANR
jgi:2-hydroxychromene-2-carboxylate isomerase